MKNILKLVSALTLIAIAGTFTSCGLFSSGPTDTWCEKTVTISDTPVYVAFVYSKNGLTGETSASTKLKNGVSVDAGLTVLVWASVAISDIGLSANTYITKTYTTISDIFEDAESSEDSSSYGNIHALWSAIYLSDSNLMNTDNQYADPLAPAPLTNASTYSEASSDVISNFSWKTVLKAAVNLL